MPEVAETRYDRQGVAFGPESRRAAALAVIGALDQPRTAAAVLAGAAAMGIPEVGCDDDGPAHDHWLLGNYPGLVARISADVGYRYIDPQCPGLDLDYLRQRPNAWIVVLVTDPDDAREAVAALARDQIGARVLLVAVGPGGVVVEGHGDASSAAARLAALSAAPRPTGPEELSILGAGLALNVLMNAGRVPEGSPQVTAPAAYSLHRRRRVAPASDSFADLVEEISRDPSGPVASFADRSLVMVGAGALGNWAAIPIALDGPRDLLIYDGDTQVMEHNLNRQILLVDGVEGTRAKAEVLVDQLRALAPGGAYRASVKFIEDPADLGSLGDRDALVAAPDNDAARLTCDDARRRSDVVFATAGSSALGGQAIVRGPRQGCLRCLGIGADPPARAGARSCALAADDAVVSSNMVAAGLLISELREALAGRDTANIRFVGDAPGGGGLVRMISGTHCPHVAGRADGPSRMEECRRA